MTEPLSPDLTRAALAHLGVAPGPPGLALLDALIDAYTRTVPWESASRIVRRAGTRATEECPRWGESFWRSAIDSGTGGTCFESNGAFFALLRSLGFEGYLTVNNMMERAGCHTAIVVLIDGRKWLVDAGYPAHCALPLDPLRATERATPLFSYTVQPLEGGEYLIENRPHPKPYMFNLIDRPVPDEAYRRATTEDYGPQGLFLDRVIMRKVVGGRVCRFASDALPYHIEEFHDGERIDHPLEGELDDIAAQVGGHFGVDRAIVAAAMRRVTPAPSPSQPGG